MGELIEAIFKAGVPAAVVSFILFHYSLKKGQFTETSNTKLLKKEIKAYRKAKSHKQKSGNILHDKWMKFGGGFYGVMAFWTYISVETMEIINFFEGVKSFSDVVDLLNVGTLFNLLINSLKNFITSISWPIYWSNTLDGINSLLWLGVSYGGYSFGMNYGRHHAHLEHIRKKTKTDDKNPSPSLKPQFKLEYLLISFFLVISIGFLFMPSDQNDDNTSTNTKQIKEVKDDR